MTSSHISLKGKPGKTRRTMKEPPHWGPASDAAPLAPGLRSASNTAPDGPGPGSSSRSLAGASLSSKLSTYNWRIISLDDFQLDDLDVVSKCLSCLMGLIINHCSSFTRLLYPSNIQQAAHPDIIHDIIHDIHVSGVLGRLEGC